MMSTVRPVSFLSPLQIGIGAYIYKKLRSKELIVLLYNLGLRAPYDEIQKFESLSVMRLPPEIQVMRTFHHNQNAEKPSQNNIILTWNMQSEPGILVWSSTSLALANHYLTAELCVFRGCGL